MEDYLILDAIERFHAGTMPNDEVQHLNNLRKTNAAIDQLAVEHIYFIEQIEKLGKTKNLKNTLEHIHNELSTAGDITTNTKAKVIPFYKKYKQKLAVAATIVGLVTVSLMGLLLAYKKTVHADDITQLKNEIKNQKNEINNVKSKITTVENNTKQSTVIASTTGTGFVVLNNGYILTNYHVIAGSKSLYVYNELYGDLTAEVYLTDATNDLAIIKITDTSYHASKKLPYSFSSNEVTLSQKIYTLGYSRPPGLVYSEGLISSKAASGSLQNKQNYLLTLQVDNGSSGSPILNNKGEIVGIISAKEKLENGYAIGVKPSSVKNIIDVLKQHTNNNTKLYGTTQIAAYNRDEQIKKIQDYIFMIKVK